VSGMLGKQSRASGHPGARRYVMCSVEKSRGPTRNHFTEHMTYQDDYMFSVVFLTNVDIYRFLFSFQ